MNLSRMKASILKKIDAWGSASWRDLADGYEELKRLKQEREERRSR